jgi:hypothetical protein
MYKITVNVARSLSCQPKGLSYSSAKSIIKKTMEIKTLKARIMMLKSVRELEMMLDGLIDEKMTKVCWMNRNSPYCTCGGCCKVASAMVDGYHGYCDDAGMELCLRLVYEVLYGYRTVGDVKRVFFGNSSDGHEKRLKVLYSRAVKSPSWYWLMC